MTFKRVMFPYGIIVTFGQQYNVVLLRFRLHAFTKAAALRSIFPRSSILCSMRPDSHTCFFHFSSFFGDVAFSEYFFFTIIIIVFSWNEEYEYVAPLHLPDGV